jgi:hypothetical protein
VARTGRDDEDASAEDLVGELDDDAIRRLLVAAAESHGDVARAVRLATAGAADRLGVLRAEVDRGLRTRRYLGYREASEWACEAQPVVDALADAVTSSPSRELVGLAERATGHVVKVILHADDSDGMIGGLAQQLLEVHTRGCDAGVADPARLARWMVRFTFDDQDFFVVDPVRYAAALGDAGMAAYRREVTKRSAGGADQFALRYAIERLAILDGDVDRLVVLLGGDLSAPYQFIRVTDAMLELDRPEAALGWARRGIAETSGWQVGKLYDLAASVLASQNDSDELLHLRREQHERMPSASTYALLQAAAVELGGWDEERDAARAVLAAHDQGGLVDALLADGDTEGAWTVATDGTWDPGETRWQRLAEAREPIDPAEAMAVYLRLADGSLVTADRRAYRVALRHLKAARRAARVADRTDEFTEHVRELREQHRRRPSLIEMLDKAGLA